MKVNLGKYEMSRTRFISLNLILFDNDFHFDK